jgi:hypothetical protein
MNPDGHYPYQGVGEFMFAIASEEGMCRKEESQLLPKQRYNAGKELPRGEL